MTLEKSCRKDNDCSENYYCRLSGVQHVSNKNKLGINSVRVLSSKFNSRGFEFTANGTCALKGNLGAMFNGVNFRIRITYWKRNRSNP